MKYRYFFGSKGENDNHFSQLKNTVNLTSLIKIPLCFKVQREPLLDILLANRSSSFQKTEVCETGLTYFHKNAFNNILLCFHQTFPLNC